MGCFEAFPFAIHSIDNTIHNYVFVEQNSSNPGSPLQTILNLQHCFIISIKNHSFTPNSTPRNDRLKKCMTPRENSLKDYKPSGHFLLRWWYFLHLEEIVKTFKTKLSTEGSGNTRPAQIWNHLWVLCGPSLLCKLLFQWKWFQYALQVFQISFLDPFVSVFCEYWSFPCHDVELTCQRELC